MSDNNITKQIKNDLKHSKVTPKNKSKNKNYSIHNLTLKYTAALRKKHGALYNILFQYIMNINTSYLPICLLIQLSKRSAVRPSSITCNSLFSCLGSQLPATNLEGGPQKSIG